MIVTSNPNIPHIGPTRTDSLVSPSRPNRICAEQQRQKKGRSAAFIRYLRLFSSHESISIITSSSALPSFIVTFVHHHYHGPIIVPRVHHRTTGPSSYHESIIVTTSPSSLPRDPRLRARTAAEHITERDRICDDDQNDEDRDPDSPLVQYRWNSSSIVMHFADREFFRSLRCS